MRLRDLTPHALSLERSARRAVIRNARSFARGRLHDAFSRGISSSLLSQDRRSPSERPPVTTPHLVSTVSVPRLAVAVECEAGRPVTREVIVDGDTCRIGAHSSNDLVLHDPSVSRFHCRLVLEDGLWRVRDWSSLNGTRLDGIRIRDADLPVDATLAMGDSLVR